MSRYIEWDDVVARYRRASDVAGADEMVDTYVDYAENEVDALLAPYFTAPFSNNNVTVRDLSIDLAFSKILMFKDTEKATAIYSMTIAKINDLVQGRRSMVVDSGNIVSRSANLPFSTTKDYHPVFGMGNSIDFQVSSDQLSDEEGARE